MTTWVLVHGTPLSPAVWDGVSSRLTDQPVVCPDVSHLPDSVDVQATVAGRLAPSLPPGRWDLVGHSFGGQIALELALARPERIRSLTVLCSRDTPFPAFAAVADAVAAGKGPTVEAGLARWFVPAELAAHGDAVARAKADLAVAHRAPRDWARALRAISTFDRAAAAATLDVPVTLLAQRHDAVSTPEVMAAFAERLPRAALHVGDGAHMSPFVDPAQLTRSLVSFRDEACARSDPRR